jgi:hypothetical protein
MVMQDYIARKRAEGKTGLEAMRCLKRHLARRGTSPSRPLRVWAVPIS